MSEATTPGRAFYDRQVSYLENGNFDGLKTQYHDDAVLVTFDQVIHGNADIKRHMEAYLEHLGSLKLISTDKFVETEDSIFFEATMRTAQAEAKVYDVFMLKDGKAAHHFTGVLSVTPFSSSA